MAKKLKKYKHIINDFITQIFTSEDDVWIEVGKEEEFKEEMLKAYPDDWFKCDSCKEIYEKGTSESDVIAEYKENFPNDPEMTVPRGIICDDCYQELYKQTNGFNKKPRINLGKEYLKQWSIDEK